MPSIFGHAFIGVTAAQFPQKKSLQPKILILSLMSSLAPDVDIFPLLLGMKYDSPLGHRGFFHSLFFSLFLGYFSTAVLFRSLSFKKTLREWRWILFFGCITLSHPLLDAMTTGGHGVALFSPFSFHRYFFTARFIPVSPLSPSDFFSLGGIRILLREVLFILFPCFLALSLRRKVSLSTFLVLMALTLGGLTIYPGHLIREELVQGIFATDVSEIDASALTKKEHGIHEIPVEGIPDRRLLVNYNDLLKRGLLNTPLKPTQVPWASYSFPTWRGGAAGRWQKSAIDQGWAIFMGNSPWNPPELLSLLHRSEAQNPSQALKNIPNAPELNSTPSEIDQLSPTEKYDLALGDYFLSATRSESAINGILSLDVLPQTPLWSGYCDTLSFAALYEKEPKHTVTVLTPDHYLIRFLPTDIKGLLGIAYFQRNPPHWQIGSACYLDGPRNQACLGVNPASLVIALTNLVGMAKVSFILDKAPFSEIQNRPIRMAMIKVIHPPSLANQRPFYFKIAPEIQYLVEIEIELTVAAMSPWRDSPEEEVLTYRATLGLDENRNLVGGRWEDPFHHPNFAWGGLPSPTHPMDPPPGRIGNRLEWSFVQALVEESSKEKPEVIRMDSIRKDAHSQRYPFQSDSLGISGK